MRSNIHLLPKDATLPNYVLRCLVQRDTITKGADLLNLPMRFRIGLHNLIRHTVLRPCQVDTDLNSRTSEWSTGPVDQRTRSCGSRFRNAGAHADTVESCSFTIPVRSCEFVGRSCPEELKA